MMTKKQKKLATLLIPMFLIISALYLIFSTLKQNIVYFKTPTEILENSLYQKEKRLRIGGLVKKGTLKRQSNQRIKFILTDFKNSLHVTYHGILPDLFREGQCIIAEGQFEETSFFTAEYILAKHDENYVPRELQDSLKNLNASQYYANCINKA